MCKMDDDDSSMTDFFSYFQISVMFHLTNVTFLCVSDIGMRKNRQGVVPILKTYILILFFNFFKSCLDSHYTKREQVSILSFFKFLSLSCDRRRKSQEPVCSTLALFHSLLVHPSTELPRVLPSCAAVSQASGPRPPPLTLTVLPLHPP